MTSEIETLKTNEFLRRRKLRLQQVREQSKDIAKKLRLRAKVEKFRHIVELDEQQENEYLERQERIVQQLEQVYAKGKQNAGASHNRAFVDKSRAEPVVLAPAGAASVGSGVSKFDIAKIRAREATAQLRQQKQEALDSKNRLLQRKLKAREAANEISRERTKSASHSKEPSAQGTEGSEKLIQVHNPCQELHAANQEFAEKFIQNTPQSQGVLTDPIELEDRPASAIILEPEASAKRGEQTTSKQDTVPPESEIEVCQTNSTAKRKNFYTIFHNKTKQSSDKKINKKTEQSVKKRNEMATQWNSEFLPNEWVPNVPKLKLPDNDKVSTVFMNAGAQKPRPAKTNNLFELSEDMPSSLRTKRAYSPPSVTVQSRSSLTLVSEYLHQRQLRLRDHDAPGPNKRHDAPGQASNKRHEHKDDLQHCKQTIMWARSSHNEGITYKDLCSVHDEQVIPVPTWKPESALNSPRVPSTPRVPEPTFSKANNLSKPNSRAPSPRAKPPGSGKVTSPTTSSMKCKAHGSGLTNSDINEIFKSFRPLPSKKSPDIITLPPKGVKLMPSVSSDIIDMHPRGIKQPSSNAISNESSNIIDFPLRPPSPVIRGVSPFRRNKLRPNMFNQANTENPGLKTVPLQTDKAKNERRKRSNITMYNHFTKDKRMVEADESNLVLRDDTPAEDAYSTAMRQSEDFKDKPRHEKPKSNRNRIATDKQMVEKEYQDTMAFLNSLAKGQATSHRPIRKAYMDEDRQANFEERHQRKMQHKYRKIEKEALRKHSSKSPSKDTQGRRTKSPGKTIGADGHPGDFQYSWMPVPDSDASLFVHTIPTTTKDDAKFQKIDCYHEYRSRHKHTPPTKEKHSHNRTLQQSDSFAESEYYSSHDSRTSNNEYSLEEDRRSKKKSTNKDSSDAERIIVYKILESKRKKDRSRKKTKFSGENVRSMTSVRNALIKTKKVVTNSRQGSLDQLNEGVYKKVSPKGQFCNMISSETTNIEFWQATAEPRPWWDNIQSLYFPASHDKIGDPSSNKTHHEQERDVRQMQWDCGDKLLDERSTGPTSKQSQSTNSQFPAQISHVTYTKSSVSRGQSISTEKGTVQTNIETLATGNTGRQEGGYVKLLGEKGEETEKLILGAAGLLNEDGYEVVIQLRKKETGKNLGESKHQLKENPSQDLEGVDEVTSKLVRTVSSQSSLPYLEPAVEEKNSVPAHNTDEANQLDTKPSEKDNGKITKQTVCTQTSLHSPSQRSFMFMSSSTSTAYMSPPETILPACLKHSSETTTNKSSDYSKSCSSKNQYPRCSKKHVKCRCHKCIHAKLHDDASDLGTRETQTRKSHTQVPPNTARSEVLADVDKKPSRQCTCPKCCYDKVIKAKSKRRRRRQHQCADKDYAVLKKNVATTKLYKEELNPIIKDYVKRLLTLNKEGLKAIEVLNQECSSVTTPGSSIVNIDSNLEDKRSAEAKLSLEHLKNILLQKIDEESKKCNTKTQPHRKKKTVHKIKSFNISKHLLRKKSESENAAKPSEAAQLPSSTSAKENDSDQAQLETMVWNRSPKQTDHKKVLEEKHTEASISSTSATEIVAKLKKSKVGEHKTHSRSPSLPLHKLQASNVISSSTDYKAKSCGCSATTLPRQREHHGDTKNNVCEENFIVIAETKVQNMERIANLTEKCTQRLSNLAKVLEEVRKNKSSAFSHLSTGESSSESEQKSNQKNIFKSLSQSQLPHNISEAKDNLRHSAKSLPAKSLDSSSEGSKLPEISDCTKSFNVEDKFESPQEYPSILEGIPKPSSQVSPLQLKPPSEINNNGDCLKRGKPPPALTRMKHGPDDIIPHELSTVVEVDSPMSMKFKTQESVVMENKEPSVQTPKEPTVTENLPNPDLVQSNVKLKPKSAKKTDGSKMEMMDLNKFNEIMLKPFVSIEEFAKRCNVREFEDGSNIGDTAKDTTLNDDLSSMHSEGSLPDVIGELLKRNLITEPFKFDTGSNIQSTTISSESSISVLALSKLNNKEKKKPYISMVNREIAETSDTLSVSSNPDLENAFKKLGMGWASSTLKKTKERLALSSSSSSSSCSQKYTLKAFEKHESPTNKKENKNSVSVSTLKNAEQQTLHLKGVTVQEFLTNELANKITFNNKSQRDETEQEFITLHETKMPEEMKYSIAQEQSADNSGANANRARTSTPVQLFKSLTYHSSSSSNNISNGLFSNVDDLSSVKVTSSSLRNHSTSDKDDLTIPNFSLKIKRNTSDASKSE